MTDNVSEYSARHGCFCDPQSARKPSYIAHALFKVQRIEAVTLGIPSIRTMAHSLLGCRATLHEMSQSFLERMAAFETVS